MSTNMDTTDTTTDTGTGTDTTTGDPISPTNVTTTVNPDGTVVTTVTQGETGDPLGSDIGVLPIGQESGQWVGRGAISDALGRAEDTLAGYLGFSLGKKNHCETVRWPRTFTGALNPCANVQLKRAKVDAIGRVESQRVMDLNITLVDRNGDRFVDGFEGGGFVGGVNLTKDNADSFFLRHKNADELGCSYQAFSDTQIKFTPGPGGTYVDVLGPLHEIVKPQLLTARSGAGQYQTPQNVWDPCIYTNCIELAQRRIVDVAAVGARLSCCGGCNACNGTGQNCRTCEEISVCLVDPQLGVVRLQASPSACASGELSTATIHYVGGDCCEGWEELIIRLAVAELGVESFQVPSAFVTRWGSVASGADNPLGDRFGHEYAWRFIQEKRDTSRGIVLA